MDIHASTQMTQTGVYGSRLLKELGASRIVTSREMNLQEIKQLHLLRGNTVGVVVVCVDLFNGYPLDLMNGLI